MQIRLVSSGAINNPPDRAGSVPIDFCILQNVRFFAAEMKVPEGLAMKCESFTSTVTEPMDSGDWLLYHHYLLVILSKLGSCRGSGERRRSHKQMFVGRDRCSKPEPEKKWASLKSKL